MRERERKQGKGGEEGRRKRIDLQGLSPKG